ncbi:hypothetical protein WNY37_13345 [Henriciella sp. AS95]|uniref:hypothetical protein n=1 Tax=Henriciella sp. AS95 TaxID=3135782 RepID=UPI003173322A
MINIVKELYKVGPLIFAFGFLAPLCAQLIERTGAPTPFDLTPLATGFLVAALLGIPAQIRGRWI